jgi:wyosine [tRNA(Phe)-imidazoG37] synthetase (radical SAM superfamily)
MKTQAFSIEEPIPPRPAQADVAPPLTNRSPGIAEKAFGQPRGFLGNRFVYAVISQRARGLSIGINLNPDKLCNFDCAYCEVNRDVPGHDRAVDLKVLALELEALLTLTFEGKLRDLPYFHTVPAELLALKEVALSGDGEPTLCSNFQDVVGEVVHLRSRRKFPFFKIVLITNTTGLDRSEVRQGLRHLTSDDEIWAKLDAGTQAYMDLVNRPKDITLKKVLHNILLIARERPVIIQSLFPLIDGNEPPAEEIEECVHRLHELRSEGAKISLVQIYSAHRAPHRPNCAHLRLKSLSRIAQRVREATGLAAEVF